MKNFDSNGTHKRKNTTSKELNASKIDNYRSQLKNEGKIKKSNQTLSKLFLLIKLAVFLLITVNVLGPIVVYVWPNIMAHMIFETFIFVPFKNLSNPIDFGLTKTYSFKLNHDNVELGAWHVLPQDAQLISSKNVHEHFNFNIPRDPSSPKPIIVLYLHGNTNDRSTAHRVTLYKKLQSMNYHVVAVDYRGFGDSTGVPTEADITRDALFAYEYLQSVAQSASVYIWGHSLGTGVSSNLARILTEKGKPASGVVLEAPFYNIEAEIEFHPFTWIFSLNFIMLNTISDALKSIELQFRSDLHLVKVESKMLIIHAEDDWIIPVYEGEKLYEVVSKSGKSKNLLFHKIPSHFKCGHNKAYNYPGFESLIKSFITNL